MEVVLFRSPSDDYRACLAQDTRISGVHFVPVLEERLHPPTDHTFRAWLQRYSGFIFTSKRAVESFAIAWRHHRSDSSCELADSSCELVEGLAEDSSSPRNEHDHATDSAPMNLPCYVVGPATARAVRSMANFPVFGEESGNAQTLAERIPHLHSKHLLRSSVSPLDAATVKPLLFLCGDKRRDTIAVYFEQYRPVVEGTSIPILVEEYQAYETVPSTSIPADLQSVLGHLLGNTARPIWLVFFSPSGVDAVWPCLEGLLLELDPMRFAERGVPAIQQSGLHIAAIGPTTMEHLQTVYHIPSSLLRMANIPSAEGLLECMIHS